MSKLSMKGKKEKKEKVFCLFKMSFYIETLLIESLFCHILSICAWRDRCMQMPLEKREAQSTEGNQEIFKK